MTCKLLLALAMSVIVLIGCRASKPDVENSPSVAFLGAPLSPPNEKRMNRIRYGRGAQPSRLHQLCVSRDATVAQIQEVLDLGDDVNARSANGTTPLVLAVENTNPEVILVLLEAGADVNAKDGSGMTPLMSAVGNTNLEVISVLLEAGADVHARAANDMTPLMSAVGNTNPEVISVLLEAAGADVNAKADYLNLGFDISLLMYAVLQDTNTDVISVLLEAGADVNERVNGNIFIPILTPLVCAVENTNPEVILVLLRAGADVNAKADYLNRGFDISLLMYAVLQDTNTDVISVLLRAGADVNARDNNGKTALDYAKEYEELKGTQAIKELEAATNP